MLPAKRHRLLNTGLLLMMLCITTYCGFLIQEKFQKMSAQQIDKEEIAQIIIDEDYRSCAYNDSLGKRTIGFGHLIKKGEKFGCLTPKQAIDLLKQDYLIAKTVVQKDYVWAVGDTQRALINMHYQMGQGRVKLFKKALRALEDEDYYTAAIELMDSRWYVQTPRRAQRIIGRVLSIDDSW